MKNTHEFYNLTKEQYEDIVAPYKQIILALLKNEPMVKLSEEELIEMLKEAEKEKSKE